MSTKKKTKLKLEDFKEGFKYQCFIGYGWVDCEYPHTGFSPGKQLEMAIKDGAVAPAGAYKAVE